jgi:hypothetical protein
MTSAAKPFAQSASLERIQRIVDGVRFCYELTDNATGVWERYTTLAEVDPAIRSWREQMKEVVFIGLIGESLCPY